jgi:hypothetical protein
MSKKTKLNIIVGIITFSMAAYYISMLGSEVALMERFPDIEPQLVIKAHREIMRNTFKGKYNHLNTEDDAVLDEILLDLVASYK